MTYGDFARELAERRGSATPCLALLRTVGSTSALARRLVGEYRREGMAPPSVDLIAWGQQAGRGRGGRTWSSPAGKGIYVTLVRNLPSAELGLLPLRVALALCDALNRYLDGRCGLKWPNDLLVAGRKLGGVLIETVADGAASVPSMIGFGVNYAVDDATSAGAKATSLEGTGGGVPPMPVLAAELIGAVEGEVRCSGDPARVTRRVEALSVHRPGDPLRCRQGSERLEGTFVGFDPRGCLRLQVEGEERILTVGDVEIPAV